MGVFLLTVLLSSFHAFHVSVMEIKYKEDVNALQISMRIFLDDTEEALHQYTKNQALDIMEPTSWQLVETSLGSYLVENISFKDEKKELELNYLGAEIEDDVIWAYLEIQKVKKLKTIELRNAILTETFPDQENMVHFRAFGKVKSTRLGKGSEIEVFKWD